MATRLQKLLWSILAGTALGLGGAACGDDTVEYGPPNDVSTDEGADPADVAEETAVDPNEEEPMQTDYGPMPDF